MNLTWYTNENLRELQDRGFRPASESEQGWFVLMGDGRKAWATDAPTNDDDHTDLILTNDQCEGFGCVDSCSDCAPRCPLLWQRAPRPHVRAATGRNG
jgi:hypothetical protein